MLRGRPYAAVTTSFGNFFQCYDEYDGDTSLTAPWSAMYSSVYLSMTTTYISGTCDSSGNYAFTQNFSRATTSSEQGWERWRYELGSKPEKERRYKFSCTITP